MSVYPGYVNLESGEFVDYPFTMKFYDPNWRYAGQNFEIIRYADILLMYAEVTPRPHVSEYGTGPGWVYRDLVSPVIRPNTTRWLWLSNTNAG